MAPPGIEHPSLDRECETLLIVPSQLACLKVINQFNDIQLKTHDKIQCFNNPIFPKYAFNNSIAKPLWSLTANKVGITTALYNLVPNII